jgi:hypothetical protein
MIWRKVALAGLARLLPRVFGWLAFLVRGDGAKDAEILIRTSTWATPWCIPRTGGNALVHSPHWAVSARTFA